MRKKKEIKTVNDAVKNIPVKKEQPLKTYEMLRNSFIGIKN